MRIVRGRKIPKILYHWSLRSRRASILKRGLRIGSQSAAYPGWRPPYVCLGISPVMAISLCLWRRKGRNTVLDLYEVYPTKHYTVKRRRDCGLEYRIYNHIPKARVRLIASTSLRPNQKRGWR